MWSRGFLMRHKSKALLFALVTFTLSIFFVQIDVFAHSGATVLYGRRIYHGYFDDVHDGFGTYVMSTGAANGMARDSSGNHIRTASNRCGGSFSKGNSGFPISSASDFTSHLLSKYDSGNTQDRTGASFIIHTLLGAGPGTNESVSSSERADLTRRVSKYANGDDSDGYRMLVNQCYTFNAGFVNSYYQGTGSGSNPSDDAFTDNTSQETQLAIRFQKRNSSGSWVDQYIIKQNCGNPAGVISEIDEDSPPVGDFSTTGGDTCTVNGWALDIDFSGDITIAVREGGSTTSDTLLYRGLASANTPDPPSPPYGSYTSNGFNITLPDSYRDGSTYSIFVNLVGVDSSGSGNSVFVSLPSQSIRCNVLNNLEMTTRVYDTDPEEGTVQASIPDRRPGQAFDVNTQVTNSAASTENSGEANLRVYARENTNIVTYTEINTDVSALSPGSSRNYNTGTDNSSNQVRFRVKDASELNTNMDNRLVCFRAELRYDDQDGVEQTTYSAPNDLHTGSTVERSSACFRLDVFHTVVPDSGSSVIPTTASPGTPLVINAAIEEIENIIQTRNNVLSVQVRTADAFTANRVNRTTPSSAPSGWSVGSNLGGSFEGNQWVSGELGKGGSLSGFNAIFNLNESAAFGDNLCFFIRVVGGDSTNTAAVADYNFCVVVEYPRTPYLEVIGGDVYGGGSELQSDGTCSYAGSGSVRGNVYSGPGISRLTYGQFMVSAATSIADFGSRNASPPSGGSGERNQLWAQGDQACRPDLIYTPDEIASDAQVRQDLGLSDDTLIISTSANSLDLLNFIVSNPGFASASNIVVLHTGSSQFTILPDSSVPGGVLTIPNGKRVTVYTAQDVVLRTNILFSRNYANYDDIPAFALISDGSIKVARGVGTLTGMYYASDEFDTCTETNGSAIDLSSLPGGTSYPANQCYRQLIVNGSLSAGTFLFRRIGERTAANPQSSFAERINTIVEQYLARPPIYDAITSRSAEQKNQLQNERPPLL